MEMQDKAPMLRDARSGDARLQADRHFAAARWTEARTLLQAICRDTRSDLEALIKLSIAERQCGDVAAAEKHARAAVRRAPTSFLSHQVLGLALHAGGATVKAAQSYRNAIGRAPDYPDNHYLLGCALQSLGRLAEAADAFERALALRPAYPDAMSGLAAVRLLQGATDEAARLLEAALALDPGSVEALANLAVIREQAGATEDALVLYRLALDRAPERRDLRAMTAVACERFGQVAEAQALIADCDVAADPLAALVAARIAQRNGQAADGLAQIDATVGRVADPMLAGEMHKLAAQLLDAQGRNGEAFTRAEQGNALLAKGLSIDLAAPPPYLDTLGRLRALESGEAGGDLAPADAAPFTPCFLIGFPRSGTTLMEQMLDGHPDLSSIDEKPIVEAVFALFARMARDDGATLATLTAGQRDRLREAYFDAAKRHLGTSHGPIVLDKLPLNIVHVPLIVRILPEARFVLALRHPLDVAMSCFLQNFAFNDATKSFLSTRHIALTYRAVMQGWRAIAERPDIRARSIRYEDVVSDPVAALTPMLAFLGLGWDDAVLDHAATARSKAIINTPSYQQVSRPLYRASVAKWRFYRAHLAEAAALLADEIAAFGYEPFA